MSIQTQLAEELQDAIRSNDTNRKNVIRYIETEITKARTAKGFTGEVDDSLYQVVIQNFVKQMSKAIPEYQNAGERGKEMVQRLNWEIEYLSQWLPEAPSADDIRELVHEVMEQLGATGTNLSAGQVIGQVMRRQQGLDGRMVAKIVGEVLEEG